MQYILGIVLKKIYSTVHYWKTLLESDKNGMFHDRLVFWYVHTIWKHREILESFVNVEKEKSNRKLKGTKI